MTRPPEDAPVVASAASADDAAAQADAKAAADPAPATLAEAAAAADAAVAAACAALSAPPPDRRALGRDARAARRAVRRLRRVRSTLSLRLQDRGRALRGDLARLRRAAVRERRRLRRRVVVAVVGRFLREYGVLLFTILVFVALIGTVLLFGRSLLDALREGVGGLLTPGPAGGGER